MKFRHPPPLPLKQYVKTKRSWLKPVVVELVTLNGVELSGQEREDEVPVWRFVMYECKVKGTALRNSIVITSKTRKVKLVLSNQSEYHQWLEQLNIASMWRLQNYYEIDKEIGAGKYSTVYRAWDRLSRNVVAVKVIWKMEFDPKAAGFVERERKIMQVIDHKSVVRTYDIFDEPSKLLIVLEYMEGGMLFNAIKRENKFSELNCSIIMRGVFMGLQYLHSNKIVHRDVKPDNILCSSDTWPLGVKLADFGLSNFLNEDTNYTLMSGVGTPYYVAPEMVLKKRYGCAVDMWSCGVLMYLLLAGIFPFKAHSKTETLKKIRNGVYKMPAENWDRVSEDAKDLVKRLLTVDPEKRVTASEALRHPWICGGDQPIVDLGTARLLIWLNASERGKEWTVKRPTGSRDQRNESNNSRMDVPTRANSAIDPIVSRSTRTVAPSNSFRTHAEKAAPVEISTNANAKTNLRRFRLQRRETAKAFH